MPDSLGTSVIIAVPRQAMLARAATPGQAEDFRLARHGEPALRPYLQARASNAMAQFEKDGPAPAQTSSSA